MELLMLNYLARERGVIVHSCSVDCNGSGMIFVGESGAGKSTLAGIWDREAGVDVLSDDRTILRKNGSQFFIYGTPWHGLGQFASPRKVKLEGIFFLKQGKHNATTDIAGSEAVSRFLTCCFPPFWDPQGTAFTMELFTDLASQIPCHELTFKPEKSALEVVKAKLGT